MQVALIQPTDMLGKIPNTGYHLVLPHMMNDSGEYAAYYNTVGGYKILDNGVAEGEHISWRDLIDIATREGFHELVIPDVIDDCEETLHFIECWGDAVVDSPYNLKFMAVVQGTNLVEWMRCITTYQETPWVDTIAIPRTINYSALYEDTTRIRLLDVVARTYAYATPLKPVHCLGSGKWIGEVQALTTFKGVRGIDTCSPVANGIDGLDVIQPYIGRQKNFFDVKTENIGMERIQENVRTYLKWARCSPFDNTTSP